MVGLTITNIIIYGMSLGAIFFRIRKCMCNIVAKNVSLEITT